MKRRQFLSSASAPALLSAFPQAIFSKTTSESTHSNWDTGNLSHLLPTASHNRFLIKASFHHPVDTAPILLVGDQKIRGEKTDTEGMFWQFNVEGLTPDRSYRLSLKSNAGKTICEPWSLKTFPDPKSSPKKVRVLFFTCSGGHEELTFLPSAIRSRLLSRALSYHPDAAVANGDQVYWDLRSPLTSKGQGASQKARELIGGEFDRSMVALGSTNEFLLKRAVRPQISSVYGTLFKSTPTFFLQDDHDYFDNDDAYDEIITFPPDFFMKQMARATQLLFYPEFLPDSTRPTGLPGSAILGRSAGLSESFGTLRYGDLLELMLYSVRPTMTLAGPSAVFLEDTVEAWLKDRMSKSNAHHIVNAPSNPQGWTAGKWGEWYPDVLDKGGNLSVDIKKSYWQSGWLSQHDRLLLAMNQMEHKIPLSVSGDLHAIGLGSILGTGQIDLSKNPVVSVLAGPIGTRPGGWPSGLRKIGAQPSLHLKMEEAIKPIENHGFTIADFTPDAVELQFFKWDRNSQNVSDIDQLTPFYSKKISRS
jgi:hypothetical protein